MAKKISRFFNIFSYYHIPSRLSVELKRKDGRIFVPQGCVFNHSRFRVRKGVIIIKGSIYLISKDSVDIEAMKLPVKVVFVWHDDWRVWRMEDWWLIGKEKKIFINPPSRKRWADFIY